MPDNGSRPSQVPIAPDGAKRANSSSPYQRSARVRRTTARCPGLRANATTAAASAQMLNVACSPTGASPMLTAASNP